MGLLDRMTKPVTSAHPYSGKVAGFLEKAESKHTTDFEQACIDRILRLAKGDTAPYTAMTLLKASFPFEGGFCFECQGALCYCYEAFSLETAPLPFLIHTSSLPSFAEKPYALFSDTDQPGIVSPTHSHSYCFSLKGPPNSAYLVLFEESQSSLPAPSISRVIEKTKSCFFSAKPIPKAPAPAPAPALAPNNLQESLKRALALHQKNGKVHLLILESSENKPEFLHRARAITGSLGTVFELPTKRFLIIMKPDLDNELLSHRLRKGLSVITELKVLYSAKDVDIDTSYGMLKKYV